MSKSVKLFVFFIHVGIIVHLAISQIASGIRDDRKMKLIKIALISFVVMSFSVEMCGYLGSI